MGNTWTERSHQTKICKEKNPQELVRISWGFNYETSNAKLTGPKKRQLLGVRVERNVGIKIMFCKYGFILKRGMLT